MLHAIDHFLFGMIPWEIWFLVGIGLAVAALIYIPGKPGVVIAACIMGLLSSTAAYSHGEHVGIKGEKARWETKAQAERDRLNAEFAKNLAAEKQRTADAEATAQSAITERDNAILQAANDPHADDVVIPESLAERLCSLPGARCSQDGTPGDPPRAGTVRGLLQRLRPTPSPKRGLAVKGLPQGHR